MLLACLAAAQAAPAKSKAKKAPAKKPAPTVKHYVQGTTQLSGENAQFGTTYTLCKDNPINVTLKSAEYSVAQLPIGDDIYYPNADQKLLVLHYNLHNPQKSEIGLNWSNFQITAVDSNDQNWEYIGAAGVESTKATLDMSAKPAQKIDVYTAILVPAKGEIPKLIFKAHDERVLRYDPRGKVKPLEAPFADPADKTGATALNPVPGKPGIFYPLGNWSIRFDEVSFADKALNGNEPGENSRFLVLGLTAKNSSQSRNTINWSTFQPTVTDKDGNTLSWNQDTLKSSRDETIDSDVDPGHEIKFRHYYAVPNDLPLKDYSIKEREGRAYLFDLSGTK
jgi:hypothetical protein